jgi:hypothetical protein
MVVIRRYCNGTEGKHDPIPALCGVYWTNVAWSNSYYFCFDIEISYHVKSHACIRVTTKNPVLWLLYALVSMLGNLLWFNSVTGSECDPTRSAMGFKSAAHSKPCSPSSAGWWSDISLSSGLYIYLSLHEFVIY